MASLQVLTALTALSTTVVPTDAKTLSANMAALGNLGLTDLRAVGIVCKCDQLNQFAGTNYTANHKQLMQDAKSFMGGFSLIEEGDESLLVAQMKVSLDWGAAKAKNAGLTTDVASLLNTANDLRSVPLETLNRIYQFLRYKLALLTV